jgi:hypothetical protein
MNKEFWRGDKRRFRFQYLILPLLVFASIRHAKTDVRVRARRLICSVNAKSSHRICALAA